jgi:hypothetical protein
LIYHKATPSKITEMAPSVIPTPIPTAAPVDSPFLDVDASDEVAVGDKAVAVAPVVGVMEFELDAELTIAVVEVVEVETSFKSVLCQTMGIPSPDMVISDARVVVRNCRAVSKYVATSPGGAVHAHTCPPLLKKS